MSEKKRTLREPVFFGNKHYEAGKEAPEGVEDRFIVGTKEGKAADKAAEERKEVGVEPPITSAAADATGEASGDTKTTTKLNAVSPGSIAAPEEDAKKK